MVVIIIAGPPSSGKGTQAQMISKKLNIKHVSMGQLLREEIATGSDLGEKLKSIMNKGNLVPDELTNKLASKAIKKYRNVLFDGYPRTIDQALYLKRNFEVDMILNLEVPEQIAIERMSNRRTCEKCGEVYNLKTNPPKNGICECGGKLIQRDDDKPEVIRNRLRVYHEETEPMISAFKDMNVIQSFDGRKSIEKLNKEIVDKIKNLF